MTTALMEVVGAESDVTAARADLDAAKERQTAVGEELANLRAQLEEVAGRIRAVTEAGDPRGEVRGLTGEQRRLREQLEEVEADERAQGAAVAAKE